MGKAVAGLTVQAYDAQGAAIEGATAVTDANGKYSLILPKAYAGQAIALKVVDTSADGTGYLDESTGEQKDLSVTLRANVIVGGSNTQVANITHATEIAAQLAQNLGKTSAHDLSQINASVAKFLGVGNIISDTPDFTSGDGDTSHNSYGKALALLSALDSVNERNGASNPTQTTVQQLSQALEASATQSIQGAVTSTINDANTLNLLAQAVTEVAQSQGSTLATDLTSVVQKAVQTSATSVFITANSNLIGLGKSVTFSFHFGEPPDSATVATLQAVLTVQGGTLSGLTAAVGDGKVYTATFTQAGGETPRLFVTDEVNFFANDASLVLDDHPPALSVSRIQGFAATDSARATPVSIVKSGDTVRITLSADEAVQVTGTPTIQLNVGGTLETAVFNRNASGTRSLAFDYTVGQGVTDVDGIRIDSFALNGGSILDFAGNAAAPPALGYTGLSVQVDTTAPTVVSQLPADGSTVGNAGVPSISLAFSEAVRKGTGTVTLQNLAGTTTIKTWNVAEGSLSADGLSIRFMLDTTTLAAGDYKVSANAGSFLDTAGNILDAEKLAADGLWNFTVGAVNLSIDKVSDDNLLNRAEVMNGANGRAISLTGTLSSSDTAMLQGISAGNLVVKLRPVAGGADVFAEVHSLEGGVWRAEVSASNAANLSGGYVLTASIDGSNVKASASSLLMVDREARLSLGTVAGDNQISLQEQAIINSGKTLNIGFVAEKGATVNFSFRPNNGGPTVNAGAFVGTGANDLASLKLSGANLISLGSGEITLEADITDVAGNTDLVIKTFTIEAPPSPAVLSDVLVSGNRSGALTAGDTLTAVLAFDKPVSIVGADGIKLTLTVNNNGRTASFAGLSADRTQVLFTYTVQEGESDGDGVSITAKALSVGTNSAINDLALGSSVAPSTLPPKTYTDVTVSDTTPNSFTANVVEAGVTETGAMTTGISVASGKLVPATSVTLTKVQLVGGNEFAIADNAPLSATNPGATTISGKYGKFLIGRDGSYRYLLNNANEDTQALAAEEQGTETLTFWTSSAPNTPRTLTITITGTNDAPVASAVTDQTVKMGEAYAGYTVPAFSDPDGDSLTYAATQTDGSSLPTWISFDPASRSFGVSDPRSAVAGSYTFKVTASDGKGGSASTNVKFTVETDATPPNLQSAVVNGDVLTLTYDETLDASRQPSSSYFQVVLDDDTGRAVNNVSVSGNTVVLKLSAPVPAGATVNITYADPSQGNDAYAIQDSAGNDAVAILNTQVVTNSSNNTQALPQLVQASFSESASGTSTITLTFSEPMQVSPDALFAIYQNGNTNTNILTGTPDSRGNTVTFATNVTLAASDYVVLSYFDAGALGETGGNAMGSGSVVIGGSSANTVNLSQNGVFGLYYPVTLRGNAGDDVLTGTSQNDVLIGGAGSDTLEGGWGADIIALTDGSARARDVVKTYANGSTQSQPYYFDRVTGFDVSSAVSTGNTNDVLDLPSQEIAADTATDVTGTPVGSFAKHAVAGGIATLKDSNGDTVVVTAGNHANLYAAIAYLEKNFTSPGKTVALAYDDNGDSQTDSLLVFQDLGGSAGQDVQDVMIALIGTHGVTLGTTPGQDVVQLQDTSGPRPIGATVSGNTLTLTATETIATADLAGLTLQKGSGSTLTSVTPLGVTPSGNTVAIDLGQSLAESDYVMITVTDLEHQSFADAWGNQGKLFDLNQAGVAIGGTGNTVMDLSALSGNFNLFDFDGGNDSLTGNAGDNQLSAGSGNDSLAGGAGKDWLNGGAGADTFNGGYDADTYQFTQGDSPLATYTNGVFSFANGADIIDGAGFATATSNGNSLQADRIYLQSAVPGQNMGLMDQKPTDGSVAEQQYYLVRGTWAAATCAFTRSDSGADTLVVYDGTAGAGVSVSGIVLTGVTPTQLNVMPWGEIYLRQTGTSGGGGSIGTGGTGGTGTAPAVLFVRQEDNPIIAPAFGSEKLRLTVMMDQAVLVTGSPTLDLVLTSASGDQQTVAAQLVPFTNMTGGQTTLEFEYTFPADFVKEGDSGWQYHIGALQLPSNASIVGVNGGQAANLVLNHVGITAGNWIYASLQTGTSGTANNDVLLPWESDPSGVPAALSATSASGGAGDRDILVVPVLISDTVMTADQAAGYYLSYEVTTDSRNTVTARTVTLHRPDKSVVKTIAAPLDAATWPSGVESLTFHMVYKDSEGAYQGTSNDNGFVQLWKGITHWTDAVANPDGSRDVFIQGSYRTDAIDISGDTTIATNQRVQIMGAQGNDTITGHAGADLIWGQGGDDVISAGAGDDMVGLDEGNNTLDGGAGADALAVWLHGHESRAYIGTDGRVHLQSANGTWTNGQFTADSVGYTDDWVFSFEDNGTVTASADGGTTQSTLSQFESMHLMYRNNSEIDQRPLRVGTVDADTMQTSEVIGGVLAAVAGNDVITIDSPDLPILLGGAGNDTFVLTANAFGTSSHGNSTTGSLPGSLWDGGSGVDRISFGSDVTYKTLGAPTAYQITGIDEVDLGASGHNQLTLTKTWMTQLTDAAVDGVKTLKVLGDSSDRVNLSGADEWVLGTSDTAEYTLYTATAADIQLKLYLASGMSVGPM